MNIRLVFSILSLSVAASACLAAENDVKVVAFGDSTTALRNTVEQVYAARLPALLATQGITVQVVNSGVGGSHTGRLTDNDRHNKQHALDRFQAAVRDHKPDVVIVQFGWNDSWVDTGGDGAASRIPRAEYFANLKLIVTTLTDDGSDVILMTPNRPHRPLEKWRFERTEQYVNEVRRLALETGIPLIDVWNEYATFDAIDRQSLDDLLLDSVHPNDDGHALVAQLLTPLITRIVRRRRAETSSNAVVLLNRSQTTGVHLPASWKSHEWWVEGQGVGNDLFAATGIAGGDFHVRARLRMEKQQGSAASFFLDGNHFGFEGARDTVFVSGPLFGGVNLLGDSTDVFPRGGWIDFEAIRVGRRLSFHINGTEVTGVETEPTAFSAIGFRPWRSTMQIAYASVVGETTPFAAPLPRGYTIPTIDLADDRSRQVVIDREAGQYLGHPTTVLLEDGKTMLCVYPKGHGQGAIVYKRSTDGGRTWSERLAVPENWASSLEVPTIHRVVDSQGKKRLIVWSGLYPARLAVSEDDGESWSPLKKVGDWGGIVVMGFVEPLKAPGHYLAMFHDDGRFFASPAKRKSPVQFTLYKTFSKDGGLTWSEPGTVQQDTAVHLCEPGCVRSPDGKQMAVLLRENSRRKNSHVIFSDDDGQSWTEPRALPAALTGDRHTGKYLPDGRLFISFRDTTLDSPTKGDWVAWVGTYDDIVEGREGQYRIRLMDNHKGGDCAYPGVELLPDGTIVTTTYGHWTAGEQPYVVSVRLKAAEIDQLAKDRLLRSE